MNEIAKASALTTFEVEDYRVFATIASELSEATRKAYAVQLRAIRSFYSENGWSLFDGDAATFVRRFLSYMESLSAAGRSVSTLNKVVAAARWEASYTHPNYSGLLSSRPVKAFLVGAAKQNRAVKIKKASALTLEEVRSVHKHFSSLKTLRSVRDRAIFSLGLATALRASSFGELKLGDVQRAATIDGLLVEVRFSKTDQLGEGHDIPVARSSDRRVDPVRALEGWIALLKAHGYTNPSLPLFPRLRGQGTLTEDALRNPDLAITALLRAALVDVGSSEVRAQSFSSHSLRATFITLSSQKGVPEASIAAVSGHKSMKVLRSYDRSSVERHASTAYLEG